MKFRVTWMAENSEIVEADNIKIVERGVLAHISRTGDPPKWKLLSIYRIEPELPAPIACAA